MRVAVRDVESAKFLRPMGDVGQIVPLYAPLHEEALVARAIEGAEIVVNLTGILAEHRRGRFPARPCRRGRAHRPARRRAAVRATSCMSRPSAPMPTAPRSMRAARPPARPRCAPPFPGAVILRPSIMFGAEDAFFNRFAAMAAISPVIPMVGGATKFQPVYVGDVADAVARRSLPTGRGQDLRARRRRR